MRRQLAGVAATIATAALMFFSLVFTAAGGLARHVPDWLGPVVGVFLVSTLLCALSGLATAGKGMAGNAVLRAGFVVECISLLAFAVLAVSLVIAGSARQNQDSGIGDPVVLTILLAYGSLLMATILVIVGSFISGP